MKTISIQKQLLKELGVALKEHKELKIDVAVFFLSLFNSIPSYYREEEHQTDDISIDSQRLKKYHGNYKKYFEFFLSNGFIKQTKNYGADIGKCNAFVISEKYLLDELVTYEITTKTLLKKFDNSGRDEIDNAKRSFCELKRPHLVKFFDEKLKIKVLGADDEIRCLDKAKRSYKTAMVLIREFHTQEWKYSMKPTSDNRLHSNLTRSAKILRKHILYDDKHIVGVDLKTSQPFFLCVLIKAVLDRNKELLKQIKATDVLSDKTIEALFNLDLHQADLQQFVEAVLYKDFYSEFEKELIIDYDEDGLPYREVYAFYKKNKKRKFVEQGMAKTKVPFKTSRELVKAVVMEIFYSKPATTIKEAKVFRTIYPSVSKIFKCFHDCEVKFSYLLQYVEAYVLLDYTAKKINMDYPSMPLFSIHDALVTTKPYKDLLEQEMSRHIKDVTSIQPKLELEDWKD